ncbi:MAG TPA: DUF4097 family beta strand repeat-containing protein [Rhodothermales bacterium]|nr:DUF4097 family beta strand repeat-containing protein [Rhodothermales bacterium]
MWKATASLLLMLLFVLTALATPHPALDEVQTLDREKVLDKRFPVTEGGLLTVSVGDSDVEVVVGSSNEVHVEVWVEGRDMEVAREYFKHQRFSAEADGNTVHVRTNPPKIRFDFNMFEWRNHPQILTRIEVPEQFDANLRTSDGDMAVERMRGDIQIRTSDGDIRVGSLAGPRISLDTSDGDIEADELDADTITLETSDGDILLGTVSADRINLRTSDGDLRARQLTGNVEARTSDGDIRFDMVDATTFSARTSDGDLTIDELHASQSTVRSSDGSISLRRVTGSLDVSGSDDIRLDLADPTTISVNSSDGDIDITAPASLSADVYLRGDDVRIARSFSFQGNLQDERAEGNINGGGPMIEAKSSDGEVRLRAN